jgi:hypothetical protein
MADKMDLKTVYAMVDKMDEMMVQMKVFQKVVL